MRPITIIDRGRGPESAGTRITVFDIIPYLQPGHSPRYVDEHRDEVMAENQEIEERIARGNLPEVEARLQIAGRLSRVVRA